MRSFTRSQVIQNRAFLDALARTGNAREAARVTGLNRSMLTKRRASHPALAAEWDAALVVARAAPADGKAYRPVRLSSGRVQLRRVGAGRLGPEARQAFLSALSACANVRLAAKAAGFSHSAFYHHARTDPGFAREMRLALQAGYERLEFALIHGFTAASHTDDGWRHNDPPAIPPMTAEQALQALTLHRKTTQLWHTRPWERRRPGETTDQWSARMAAIARARDRRAFEDAEVARAAGREPEPPTRFEGDMAVYALAEKLRAEVLAAAPPKAQPGVGRVRWAKLRLRQAREAAEAGEAAEEREVRMRRTGQALFGGWRVERD